MIHNSLFRSPGGGGGGAPKEVVECLVTREAEHLAKGIMECLVQGSQSRTEGYTNLTSEIIYFGTS